MSRPSTERDRLVRYVATLARTGWFKTGNFTEVSWTDTGVVINGKSYTSVNSLREDLIIRK